MTKFLVLMGVVLIVGCIANKQSRSGEIKLNDIEFQSIFGTIDSNESKIYSLLGTGFFLTPRSDDSDSLIDSWMSLHPKASKSIRISSF